MYRDEGWWLIALPVVALAAVLAGVAAVTRQGLPSLAAVLLLVVVGGPLHLHRPGPVGRLVVGVMRAVFLPLLLAASVVTVFTLPELTDRRPARRADPACAAVRIATPTTSTTALSLATAGAATGHAHTCPGRPPYLAWLRVLLGGLLTTVTLKVILLQRYSAVARSRRRFEPGNLVGLLPVQVRDLARLRDAIVGTGVTAAARVVQLQGRWGDGKSFLLARLESYLGENADAATVPAVVLVDVWKQEAEPDMHLAVFEELLSHAAYLERFGWLQYPVLLVPGRYLASLLLRLSVGTKAAVDVGVKLPRLPWQRSFQALVGRQRHRGRRTVIVLDEIDRAPSPMSQAAIALTRRALDLPGVVVVQSYVDSLIRYKVFNPLLPRILPDLESSMLAEIYEKMLDPGSPAVTGPAADSISGRLLTGTAPAGLFEDGIGEMQTLEMGEETGRPLPAQLRRWYAATAPGTRRWLQGRFAEKFLGLHPITLLRLGHEDIAFMPEVFDSLRRVAAAVGGDNTEASRVAVRTALDAWADDQNLPPGCAPPVRLLEGELARVLQGADAAGVAMPSPELLAYYVLVAFDSALRQSSNA